MWLDNQLGRERGDEQCPAHRGQRGREGEESSARLPQLALGRRQCWMELVVFIFRASNKGRQGSFMLIKFVPCNARPPPPDALYDAAQCCPARRSLVRLSGLSYSHSGQLAAAASASADVTREIIAVAEEAAVVTCYRLPSRGVRPEIAALL